MRTNLRLILIGSALLVVVASLSLRVLHDSNEGKTADSLRIRTSVSQNIDGRPKNDAFPKNQMEVRGRALLRLKQQWRELGPGNDRMDERIALTKESIDTLLCSEELIILIKFLNERDIYNKLETMTGEVFNSSHAAEARELFIELVNKNRNDTKYFCKQWASDMGFYCPPNELEDLRSALNDNECSQEVLFGHNKALAKTDPISAISSTIDAMKTGVKSTSSALIFHDLISELPATTDFERIELMLPNEDPSEVLSPVNQGRLVLFEKWAKADPAGAANYVMADYERFDPRMIEPIVSAVLTQNQASGVEWVQTFPDGPYFDSAAKTAITHLKFNQPNEVRHLASRISDPELRKRMESFINSKEEGH